MTKKIVNLFCVGSLLFGSIIMTKWYWTETNLNRIKYLNTPMGDITPKQYWDHCADNGILLIGCMISTILIFAVIYNISLIIPKKDLADSES